MQILSVIKGCFAAYVIGVMISWGDYFWAMFRGIDNLLGPWSSLFMSVIVGGALALPLTLFVILAWFLLALRKKIVAFHGALIVGLVVFGPVIWWMNGTMYGLIGGSFLGFIFGAGFWLAAFGRRKIVILSLD